jgi:hypothetical protein
MDVYYSPIMLRYDGEHLVLKIGKGVDIPSKLIYASIEDLRDSPYLSLDSNTDTRRRGVDAY